MKVRELIRSNSTWRGLAVAVLAWTLVAGGSAVPLTALAEEAPAVRTPIAGAASALSTLTPAAAPTVTPSPTATAAPTVTPAPVAKPKKKKLTIRELVAKVGRANGLSKREVAALLWLCERESNFHPRSHSRSECHGLFQLSKGMAHGNPWQDPTWNTKRAIRYMRGRYGGVLQAKAFWLNHHWY